MLPASDGCTKLSRQSRKHFLPPKLSAKEEESPVVAANQEEELCKQSLSFSLVDRTGSSNKMTLGQFRETRGLASYSDAATHVKVRNRKKTIKSMFQTNNAKAMKRGFLCGFRQ